MVSVEDCKSHLWREALAPRSGDAHAELRDALRSSLSQVRRDAGFLASHIAEDLKEFTVHDGTHLDALWPLIDLIAPQDLRLTPPETWTLGVAIVLHDLGLAVAAYPGGRAELRASEGWPDARASALRARLGRSPSYDELGETDESLDVVADAVVLRQRHAQRAQELIDVTWGEHRLVVDPAIREALGSTAGRIAASHWWPSAQLSELGQLEGAPAGMPNAWTVRPMLLAILLRVADAAHLDAARAPRAERVLRKLNTTAKAHWDFQERLRQPALDGDTLSFVSARPFPVDAAAAWWLCRDHLAILDEELIAADALLQAHNLPRLRARSVKGIRDVRELGQLIRTEDWEPVDAQVEVSDVARLVRLLGGRALYGDQRAVPLRELLQNASDAVRARAALRVGANGMVEVRVNPELNELTITDTGVGMTVDVLTGALLDFGRSLWESDELSQVLPGLQAAGFQPTGKFGIGFFSVFMWADDVSVTSRSMHAGETDTWVLSFIGGLGPSRRPLLRRASHHERLPEPGTKVHLRLREGEDELGELFRSAKDNVYEEGRVVSADERLRRILCWLAPALPVELRGRIGDGPAFTAVGPNDWVSLPVTQLIRRTTIDGRRRASPSGEQDRIRLIGPAHAPVGRAALADIEAPWRDGEPGVLVAGGLRVAGTRSVFGFLQVDHLDASRRHGVIKARSEHLSSWASEQAILVDLPRSYDARILAEAVLEAGGDPGPLPLARTTQGFVDRGEIMKWANVHDVAFIIDVADLRARWQEAHWVDDDAFILLSDAALDVHGRASGLWSAELDRSAPAVTCAITCYARSRTDGE